MSLTDRQLEIVKRICNGESNRTIAREMELNKKTVEKDRAAVCHINGITTGTAGVVRFAIKQAIITACFCLVVNAQPILPQSVPQLTTFDASLAWDRSPSPEVIGYRVYYGTNSGKYSSSMLVGNTTNAILLGLSLSYRWFIAATAYDAIGSESDFSNEIFVPPVQKTNVVVTISLQTNNTVTGLWHQDNRLTPIILTNPPGPMKLYRLIATPTNQ